MGTDGLPEMDAYALVCIRCRVSGLVARGIVRRDEFEDTSSELYCEFLRRKSRYDPNRSHYKTFTDRVVKNLISTFVTSSSYSGRTRFPSSNRAMEDEADCRDESPSDERFSTNIAVQQAVASFPEELRNLAIMLWSESITEISFRTGTSRSTCVAKRRQFVPSWNDTVSTEVSSFATALAILRAGPFLRNRRFTSRWNLKGAFPGSHARLRFIAVFTSSSCVLRRLE